MLESFLQSVAELPLWFKAAFAALLIGGHWLLEIVVPERSHDYSGRWSHARVNLTLLLFTMLITTAFGSLLVGVTEWGERTQFGLLYQADFSIWVELLIALLALDFMAQYVAHVLLHKVRPMWRLHVVHHSDTCVDVTTGTRHHPGDFIVRELFALATIVVLGIPVVFYGLYRLITLPFTYFIHANIALPGKVDRILRTIFVTPNMHKFHHHFELPWTDSNFGGVLSIWDRLFGTYVQDDINRIHYGLNTLAGEPVDSLKYLLAVPFDPNLKRNADLEESSGKLLSSRDAGV